MITDDQVVRLFVAANPVPSLEVLDPVEPINLESISNPTGVIAPMGRPFEDESKGRPQARGRRATRRWMVAVGAAPVAVIAILLGSLTSPSQNVATPLGRSIAFWEAVAADDREAAISYLDPRQVESGVLNLFGRAHTIRGQFEWYEAVGFRWTLEGCGTTEAGNIECTVNGRNAWSEAIGVDPVSGAFFMEMGPDGITSIVDSDSWGPRWVEEVFLIFRRWVEVYHPEDVSKMWSDDELTPEGLELFRVNTRRFVEAYPSP